eukprot:TRINITY_DN60145_c1_g2_i1.p1 TRINITY_DN60145_c1_g2~~TRINITY_DN60145_c1_g2_i1.p1  ORF type:complete len:2255 (-),score=740.92 TRINITY_DN60145_c1_g2_i1:196-6960(-)
MGQRIGKAHFDETIDIFLNLPGDATHNLWEAFNDVAEGFGVDVEEVKEICQVLQEPLDKSKQEMAKLSEHLFKTFDTDTNDLTDALEFLATVALCSGMSLKEKIEYVFHIYDFDESEELTIDEVTLALRSAVTGLCKFTGEEPPLEATLEQVSQAAFEFAKKSQEDRITQKEFMAFCKASPDLRAWLNFYDDAGDINSSLNTEDLSEFANECDIKERNDYLSRATDDNFPKMPLVPSSEKMLEPHPTQAQQWITVAGQTAPSIGMVSTNTPPHVAVEMEWVHGFSCSSSRSNVAYSHCGDAVYPTGIVGLVYTHEGHKQLQYTGHTDEILCSTVHISHSPQRTLVATGEAGQRPKICIWDAVTGETCHVLKGFHKNGVKLLAFSPDGTRLASVGADENQTLAIFKLSVTPEGICEHELVFSSKTCKNQVLGLKYIGERRFVTCGVRHIYFWEEMIDETIDKRKGLFGRAGATSQACVCAHPSDPAFAISGGVDGQLVLWAGRNRKRVINAHSSAVTCLDCVVGVGVVSGGADGKVRLWFKNMSAGCVFDVLALGSMLPRIQSVCWNTELNRILVGTRGGEIFEMSDADGSDVNGQPLVLAHFADELHGLAPHPTKNEYVTVGDDKTVRVWDVGTKKLLRSTKLDCSARAVSYSPDGKSIVVGLGSHEKRSRERRQGAIIVLDAIDLTIVHSSKDSKKAITDIVFSPDGTTLAVSSFDNDIYLYNAQDMTAKGKCRGHRAPPMRMGFSNDSHTLQSCSVDTGELLYWDPHTGEQQKRISQFKDVNWSGWRLPLGHPVQWLWPRFNDGSTINAVSRTKSKNILASADNFGFLKVHRYPVPSPPEGVEPDSFKPVSHKFAAHSGPVSHVILSADDNFCMTVGQTDRTVVQWRLKRDTLIDPHAELREDPETDDEADFRSTEAYQRPFLKDVMNSRDADGRIIVEEKAHANRGTSKPWVNTIVPPSQPPKPDTSAPAVTLQLEWVYGFRSLYARQQLRYTSVGQLIFPAASAVVCMASDKGQARSQTFFTEHNDTVTCVDVHPDGQIIASGQQGYGACVMLWDSRTLVLRRCLTGHVGGVLLVAFNPQGTLMASISLDEGYSLLIHDVASGMLVASTQTDTKKPLDMCWSQGGDHIYICGKGFLREYTQRGRHISCEEAKFGGVGEPQPLLCVGFAGEYVITGTQDGQIYAFKDLVCKKTVQAHHRRVNCMWSCVEGVATGSADSTVKIWSPTLEQVLEVSIEPFAKDSDASVRSVCWDSVAQQFAVGTRAGDIFEISSKTGKMIGKGPLTSGHSGLGELHGLAAHPTKAEFATVCDDASVRVWDIATRTELRRVQLPCLARSCCYSPDGTRIAVGLGGPRRGGRLRKDGAFVVLNAADLSLVHEGRDSKEYITDIKYTPDGLTLGVASRDGKIYLYDVGNNYALRGSFDRHNSFITHFDFSKDGQYMQSNCGAFEYLVADATRGVHIPAASSLKDVHWGTHSCTLGWPVQGVWPSLDDGTNVNCVARSCSQEFLASGDDFGRLRLLRYPASNCEAVGRDYYCQVGGVSALCWSANDTHLLSAGKEDLCIAQWRVVPEEPDKAEVCGESGEDSDVMEPDFDGAESEEETFTGVKPWLATIVPPTNPPTQTHKPPAASIELDWIHGYRGQKCVSNVHYNANQKIVYPAAAVGVIYDKVVHAQNFHRSHTGDISCLSVDPKGRFAASGQVEPRAFVRIWCASAGSLIARLPAVHRRGIKCISWSPCGHMLCSVGLDADHTIAVWRSDSGSWDDAVLLAMNQTNKNKVMFAEFLPGAGTGPSSATYDLATGGVKHMLFWSLVGKNIHACDGLFGNKGKRQPQTCAAVLGSTLATGTVTGHLYLWRGRHLDKAVKAHEKAVTSLSARGEIMVSAGKEGVLKLWSLELETLRSYDLKDANPSPFQHAISACCLSNDATNSTILVGTRGSELYEVCTGSGSIVLLNRGHCRHELWGLAPHPTNPHVFATAGDDRTVRVWNCKERRMTSMLCLDTMTRCLDWSPDGSLLVLGLGGRVGVGRDRKNGSFLIVRADKMEVLYEGSDSRGWLRCARFSPDGKTLALGSADNKVYLYRMTQNTDGSVDCSLFAKCEKANNSITHLDFTRDSGFLQTNDTGNELLYYRCTDGLPVDSPSEMKDKEWHTLTATLNWAAQGAWLDVPEGMEVTSCQRSNNRKWMAASDSQGGVRMYRYPCINRGAGSLSMVGHSPGVSCTRFTSDDKYLVTTGRDDRCIFQWAVTPSKTPSL